MPKKPKRRFRADGLQIFAEPIHQKMPDGTTRISLGFPVATVNKNLVTPDRVAKQIAKAMNDAGHFR